MSLSGTSQVIILDHLNKVTRDQRRNCSAEATGRQGAGVLSFVPDLRIWCWKVKQYTLVCLNQWPSHSKTQVAIAFESHFRWGHSFFCCLQWVLYHGSFPCRKKDSERARERRKCQRLQSMGPGGSGATKRGQAHKVTDTFWRKRRKHYSLLILQAESFKLGIIKLT